MEPQPSAPLVNARGRGSAVLVKRTEHRTATDAGAVTREHRNHVPEALERRLHRPASRPPSDPPRQPANLTPGSCRPRRLGDTRRGPAAQPIRDERQHLVRECSRALGRAPRHPYRGRLRRIPADDARLRLTGDRAERLRPLDAAPGVGFGHALIDVLVQRTPTAPCRLEAERPDLVVVHSGSSPSPSGGGFSPAKSSPSPASSSSASRSCFDQSIGVLPVSFSTITR